MALSRTQSRLLVGGIFSLFVVSVAFFMRSNDSLNLPEAQQDDLAKEFASPSSSPLPASTADTGMPSAATTPGTTAFGGSQFILSQFHRSELKDGKKLWEVTAQRGEYHPQDSTAELEQAVVNMYKEEKPITIRASKAILYLQGNSLTKADASGEVVVSSEQQGTLTTSQATFDKTANTLNTEAPVTISTPQLTIHGTGLHADLNNKEFVLKSDVESILIPKSMVPTPEAASAGGAGQQQKKP